jgi:hypothetical protein
MRGGLARGGAFGRLRHIWEVMPVTEPLSRRTLLAGGLAAIGGTMSVFDDAQAKATEAQAAGNQCQQQLAAMTAERDALQAQVTQLQADLDACLNPPPAIVTAFGSTPNGTTGANASTCLAKWPGSDSMRLFTPTGAGPPALPNIPVVSWSNKPPLPGTGYVNPTINVPANTTDFIWTPWHEVDGKVAQGQISLTNWKALIDRVSSQTLPAKVKLGVITTAWGITTGPGAGNRDWHQYEHPALTEWGADFDGLTASPTSYPNDIYLRTLDILDDIRAAGYRISVPEFGAPLASWDPNGTARAQWMLEWADRFKDFGMHYVCLFDHTNDGYSVNDAAGIDAWRSVL